MQKVLTVIALTIVAFFTEYLLATVLGKSLIPNFLLLLVIFLDLTLGIRYALLAAFIGGAIRDSFGVHFFGFHVLTLMLSAYLTTILGKTIYQKGSWLSLLLLIFCVNTLALLCQCALSMNLRSLPGFVWDIYLPEIIMTLLLTGVVFNYLRKCVLRLFES